MTVKLASHWSDRKEADTMLSVFRRFNSLIQEISIESLEPSMFATALSNLLGCNAFVLGCRGEILGYELQESFYCEHFDSKRKKKEMYIEKSRNEALLETTEPSARTTETEKVCVLFAGECPWAARYLAVLPVIGADTRLATLVLVRRAKEFTQEELILAESGATMAALEILRFRRQKAETRAREHMMATSVLENLSYSELKATKLLFDNFTDHEQILVARQIIKQANITQSVVVNALSKLEGAGILESHSLGAKGTHVKLLNDVFPKELANWEMS